jgi:hypothetical protein
LTIASVFSPYQRFQEVVQVPLDALAQDEAVVAGELAGVMARPEDQVICLRDDDQFLMVPANGH